MANKNKQCIVDKINKGMSKSAAASACGGEPPDPSGKKRSGKRRKGRSRREQRHIDMGW